MTCSFNYVRADPSLHGASDAYVQVCICIIHVCMCLSLEIISSSVYLSLSYMSIHFDACLMIFQSLVVVKIAVSCSYMS